MTTIVPSTPKASKPDLKCPKAPKRKPRNPDLTEMVIFRPRKLTFTGLPPKTPKKAPFDNSLSESDLSYARMVTNTCKWLLENEKDYLNFLKKRRLSEPLPKKQKF
jgi:hypothetical protein